VETPATTKPSTSMAFIRRIVSADSVAMIAAPYAAGAAGHYVCRSRSVSAPFALSVA
jgi:hypothetical protein